jgi:hypothetical protein
VVVSDSRDKKRGGISEEPRPRDTTVYMLIHLASGPVMKGWCVRVYERIPPNGGVVRVSHGMK